MSSFNKKLVIAAKESIGVVYIYDIDNYFSLEQIIYAPNEIGIYQFGIGLAMDEDIIFVGSLNGYNLYSYEFVDLSWEQTTVIPSSMDVFSLVVAKGKL
jgi:hypothetical protein